MFQVEDSFDEFDTEEFEGIDSDSVTNSPPTGAKEELKFAKVEVEPYVKLVTWIMFDLTLILNGRYNLSSFGSQTIYVFLLEDIDGSKSDNITFRSIILSNIMTCSVSDYYSGISNLQTGQEMRVCVEVIDIQSAYHSALYSC